MASNLSLCEPLVDSNKPIVVSGLRAGEKLLESLINETQSYRLEFGTSGYMYIQPSYKNYFNDSHVRDYNSTINPLTKDELKNYLTNLKLI